MKVTVPAWIRGRYVELHQILHLIGDNNWVWRLDEFHGASRPGSSLDVLSLEERVTNGPGVSYDWQHLIQLAEHVHHMIDGRLVAWTSPPAAVAILAIEAVDSSEWVVETLGDDEAAQAAAMRIAALAR
jgi:hypothetical protein